MKGLPMKAIYDRVYEILKISEEARNNDKLLMIMIWRDEDRYSDLIQGDFISIKEFIYNKKFTSSESITRARRKVQADFKELEATKPSVKRARSQKEQTKGDFVFSNDWF